MPKCFLHPFYCKIPKLSLFENHIHAQIQNSSPGFLVNKEYI